jgi:hypothetical protein
LFLSGISSITDSWIDQNYGGAYFGIESQTHGAGIYNTGDLTITRTSITSNGTAGRWSGGGGLFNTGVASIINSTISSNRAGWEGPAPISHTAYGGGIANFGDLFVTASTVTKNIAAGRALDGHVVMGGGIFHDGAPLYTAAVRSTILAENYSYHHYLPWLPVQPWAGPDAYGDFVSDGYNLVGKTDDSSGWLASDLTGSSASPLDPRLGPLQDNGGPEIGVNLGWPRPVFTTHEVLHDSPALQAGNPSLTPATDQRGVPRDSARPNIGAYEVTLESFVLEPVDPGPVYVATPFAIRVTAVDRFGKTYYVYAGTVSFGSSDPGAVLPANYAFSPADHGSAVFSGVEFSLVGLQTISVWDLLDPSKRGSHEFDVWDYGVMP